MTVIEVNAGKELAIHCKAKRTFRLVLDVGDTTDKSYKLQVRGSPPDPILTFEHDAGLSVQATTITLEKSTLDMDVVTGCFNYDLVQIDGDDAITLYSGAFVIQPSFTDISGLDLANSEFPYDFPFTLV